MYLESQVIKFLTRYKESSTMTNTTKKENKMRLRINNEFVNLLMFSYYDESLQGRLYYNSLIRVGLGE